MWVGGRGKNFFYWFRYLNYIYWAKSKRLLNVLTAEVGIVEAFTRSRGRKYPRRKRRFRRLA